MLKNLFIRNYALIDNLKVEFDNGLNILTGETGSGKSIILGAIGLLTGDRADLQSLSKKDEKCVIEGEFVLAVNKGLKSWFESSDIQFDELTIIRREIWPTGRSRAFINDTPVKLSQLKEFSSSLIDIHSQHETLQINKSDFQIKIFDNFIGLSKELDDYVFSYYNYQNTRRELESLKKSRAESVAEEDYLSFQLKEMDELDLKSIDETSLEEEFLQLSNADEIAQTLNEVLSSLDDGNVSVLELVKKAGARMGGIASLSQSFNDLHERIQSTKIELLDIVNEIENASGNVASDPSRLQYLEDVRNKLYRLQQKHQVNTLQAVLERKSEIEEKLTKIGNYDEIIRELELKHTQLRNDLISAGTLIREKRVEGRQEFIDDISRTLGFLNLNHSNFSIDLSELEEPCENGIDHLEMKFSANSDRPMRSLKETASGGELSRLMLALKKSAASSLSSTIIFDEIDTGVSGEVAHSMGNIIKSISTGIQVICITHLPQIASKGEAHFKVSKSQDNGKTFTHINRLNSEERIVEIAQLLSGAQTTEAALANARDMLYLN